jgi:hypothetical protein
MQNPIINIMNYYYAEIDSNIQLQLFHNQENKTKLQCKITLPVP